LKSPYLMMSIMLEVLLSLIFRNSVYSPDNFT